MRIAAAESGFDGVSLARRAAALVGLFRFVEVEKSESRAVGSMAAAAASNLPMLGPAREQRLESGVCHAGKPSHARCSTV